MQWVLAQQSLCLGLTITIFGLSLVGHNPKMSVSNFKNIEIRNILN